ncbi:sodium:calcium antiporter [Legionella jordanis]|uniref:Ca2+/Na+ antiporter n=1 Tax=Legionella jordanis TaxID=456 RepID=A0A0W0VD18_9GAMM|nr:sodium:calcium antiporter [Legionella jordanis]KTD17983.1 Ca2+/Na+ antiporter [Legionella jordanis]VEH13925.1 Ca2+/Na+ antiporter [Legionella jordanis]
MAFFILLVAAIVIYFSCEYFVNGVEWIGHQFNITKNATGTILAAFGTALPESIVTFVAVVFGNNPARKEIGIGAAIGGPLVLSTIAYGVVGLSFILKQRNENIKFLSGRTEQSLKQDQRWFLSIFIFKIALGLVAFVYKPWLGLLFLLAYVIYVFHEMNEKDDSEHPDYLEPLKFRPHESNPPAKWALLQTSLALALVFASSQVFVHYLEILGTEFGFSPQTMALLISPVATELPETMNAIIWVRQGKHILALANISGAMMIQATVPSAFGILFTPWLLSKASIWGAAITMLSILGLFLLLRKQALSPGRLMGFGLFYVLFAFGLWFI